MLTRHAISLGYAGRRMDDAFDHFALNLAHGFVVALEHETKPGATSRSPGSEGYSELVDSLNAGTRRVRYEDRKGSAAGHCSSNELRSFRTASCAAHFAR